MRMVERLQATSFAERDGCFEVCPAACAEERVESGNQPGGYPRGSMPRLPALTLVARQPIFTRLGVTWGYELLCCPRRLFSPKNDAEAIAAMAALSDAFAMMLPRLDPEQVLCVKLCDLFLEKDVPRILPAAVSCLEIMPGACTHKKHLDRLRTLHSQGYRIAVGYDGGAPGMVELLRVADIVKVNVSRVSPAQLIPLLADIPLRAEQLLVAEKVENAPMMRFCEKLGFNMFQGAYFSRPESFDGEKLGTGQSLKLRLLTELSNKEFDISAVSRIISSDLSVTYRLMRYLNSVHFNLACKVKSIEHGINLLGREPLRHWLSIVLLADISSNPMARNIVSSAALRGKFLELLVRESVSFRLEPASLFLVGLFSLLDALFGLPLNEVLQDVPLDESIVLALEQCQGPYAPWLEFARAYERGECARAAELVRSLGLRRSALVPAYVQALDWSRGVIGSI